MIELISSLLNATPEITSAFILGAICGFSIAIWVSWIVFKFLNKKIKVLQTRSFETECSTFKRVENIEVDFKSKIIVFEKDSVIENLFCPQLSFNNLCDFTGKPCKILHTINRLAQKSRKK